MFDPETGEALRWGLPAAGGPPRWLSAGSGAVVLTGTALDDLRMPDGNLGTNGRPFVDGTVIVVGRRLFIAKNAQLEPLGTVAEPT